MPKFFVGAIFITVITWAVFILFGSIVGPDHLIGISIFYFLLHVSLGLLLSFPLYFIFVRKYSQDIDPKIIYKKSVKYGMYISFGIVGFLILNSLDLMNPLNIVLFCLFYIVLFLQIKARK